MLLFFSVMLIVFNYFIYPIGLMVACKYRKNTHLDKIKDAAELEIFPSVSLIIAAYNEEKVIEQKITNTLGLDYPKDKIEIIIVSDGSDDDTPNIVAKHSPAVIGLHESKRGGKSAALNRAVEIAKGEILVFSDANNDFSKDAIKQLVRHFEDENIGAVTGAKHIYASDDRESAVGDGMYWKYESKIKSAESHLGSITAAEGEILAVKQSLYNPIDPIKINDDAAITFDIIRQGYRVLYEEKAKATEQASINLIDDINVKIRMTFGGYQTMSHEFTSLFPPRTWFAISFFCHKVLRWLTPHFMLITFITSLMLWQQPLVALMLIGQIVFYSVAYYGWLNRNKSLPTLVYVPMYFSVMNVALFIGFIRYLKDRSKVQWTKAER